jgi:hypothetical protein
VYFLSREREEEEEDEENREKKKIRGQVAHIILALC